MMYTNIGKKIKNIAVIICWLGIISSIAAGIILCTQKNPNEYYRYFLIGIGIYILIVGPIVSWLSLMTAYAFGELVDKTCDTAKETVEIRNLLRELISSVKHTSLDSRSISELHLVKQIIPDPGQHSPITTEHKVDLKGDRRDHLKDDAASSLGYIEDLKEMLSNDDVKKGFVNEPEGFQSRAWGSMRNDISDIAERISWRIDSSDKWCRTYTGSSDSRLWHDISYKEVLYGFVGEQLWFGAIFFDNNEKEEVAAKLGSQYNAPTRTTPSIDCWFGQKTVIAFEKKPRISSGCFVLIFISIEAISKDFDILFKYVTKSIKNH